MPLEPPLGTFDVSELRPQSIDVDEVTREYFARIHRAALVLTGSPWDADDLAQETFMVLARSSTRFEGRSNIYTWLYGILLNLERRERRRNGLRSRKLRVAWDAAPKGERSVPSAETPIEVAEWKKSLWAIVAQLPDGQRQTLILRYSEHLSYEEIAGVMKCPVGTVKSRVFHGVASLREKLAQDNQDTGLVAHAPQHPCEDAIRAV
jgi:RNA polymerase sigma-70 factor (ECF subfamily)